MTSMTTYLRWLSYLCAIMSLFGISIMIVGYKDPSFGRVATVVALAVGAVVLGYLSYRRRRAERGVDETPSRDRGDVS